MTKPYAEFTRPFGARLYGGKSGSRVRRLFRINYNADLMVPPELSALPWEAILSVDGPVGSTPRMCRTGPVPPGAFFQTPVVGRLLVNAVIKERGAVSARDTWMRALSDKSTHHLYGMNRDSVQSSERNGIEGIGVLHVLGEVRESSRGLTLEPGDGRQLFASEVARSFPQLRLVILQLPYRASDRRFEHDRAEAARARRLAGELFANGIPAVVVLPSLTEKIGFVILKKIVEVVAAAPRNAKLALTHAVHAGMRETGAAFALRPETGTEEEIAQFQLGVRETRFDFCLYCAPELNLAVVTGAKQ